MKKINVAIIGYGNIGQYALEAVLASPDMSLAGIVRRDTTTKIIGLENYKVVSDINKLDDVDVAILCTPTRNVCENAKKYLKQGINTVDSFDIHGDVVSLRDELAAVAEENGTVAIVAAGWDPGSDSVVRALMEACAPKGITYTNFGPGLSMGHSVAAKSIDGVKDALSMTIPLGTGVHRRMVYIELEDGFSFTDVENSIKKDDYFSHDDTHIIKVDNVDEVIDRGHGVNMIRKGVSGKTQNQLFEFNMKINNPALTAQIMVACARATVKQKKGAYTLIEIPMIDLLYGERRDLIKKLV